MGEPKYWHFSNTQDKSKTVSIVGLHSAKIFVSFIPLQQFANWVVKYGEEGPSRPLHEFKEFCAFKLFQSSSEINEISAVEKKEEPIYSVPRKHKRFSTRLRVVIISGKDIFNTYTKNISLGGANLENAVPFVYLCNPCKVVIWNFDNRTSAEFPAKVLESSGRGTRLMFEDNVNQANVSTLNQIISDLETYQEAS